MIWLTEKLLRLLVLAPLPLAIIVGMAANSFWWGVGTFVLLTAISIPLRGWLTAYWSYLMGREIYG